MRSFLTGPPSIYSATGRRHAVWRLYPKSTEVTGFSTAPSPSGWNTVAAWYTTCFGQAAANELRSYPVLNAGVFAAHRDAPHWARWASALVEATRNGAENVMTDQMALNYAVYRGNLFDRTAFLPSWCDWQCVFGMPAWDGVVEKLVEPPRTPPSVSSIRVGLIRPR